MRRIEAEWAPHLERHPLRLIDALDMTGATPDRLRAILREAAAVADSLVREPPETQRSLLHQLLHVVTLHPASIHIAIRRSELGTLISCKTSDAAAEPNGLIDLTAAVRLKRRGVEAKLIVGGAQCDVARPHPELTTMLVQAHRWFGQLTRGEVGSAREIARRDKDDPSQVSRTIQLAFLAPDIVEAVLAGRQPIELTPRHLMRIGDMPLEWHRQRRLLGFPA